jgi:hypothetical protein
MSPFCSAAIAGVFAGAGSRPSCIPKRLSIRTFSWRRSTRCVVCNSRCAKINAINPAWIRDRRGVFAYTQMMMAALLVNPRRPGF